MLFFDDLGCLQEVPLRLQGPWFCGCKPRPAAIPNCPACRIVPEFEEGFQNTSPKSTTLFLDRTSASDDLDLAARHSAEGSTTTTPGISLAILVGVAAQLVVVTCTSARDRFVLTSWPNFRPFGVNPNHWPVGQNCFEPAMVEGIAALILTVKYHFRPLPI